jgi:hypothetical protein
LSSTTPHVLPNKLAGRNYKDFFGQQQQPDFMANVPLIIYEELHFTDDGVPAHFILVIRGYLNQKFVAGWGIGRGGAIAWSPRSPDLNPLDFY